MQKDSHFFEDLGRMMNSATGAAMEMRRSVEQLVAAQADKMLARFNYVTREEFEAVKLMAATAREEQEKLKERLSALENNKNNGLS